MVKKKKNTARSDADRRVRQCERLARLMQTLHLISGKGRWDADALAEELGCSRRTVHRLLQTLSMAGVPWYFDEKVRAYRVRPGYKFELLDSSNATTDGSDTPDPELTRLSQELIEQGEAFSKTLSKFLRTLKRVTSTER